MITVHHTYPNFALTLPIPMHKTGMYLRYQGYSTLVLILLLTFTNAGASNRSQIDSLSRLLQTTNDLQRRIDLYTRISELYLPLNPDSAYYFAGTALKISNSKTSADILGQLHHFIGNVEVTHDSLDKAEESYLKAETYYQQSKSWDRLSANYLLLGNIFFVKDQLVKSLSYYDQGMKLAQQHDLKNILGEFYLNIGSIYYKAESYQEALHYHELAQKEFELRHDSLDIGITLSSLGLIYSDLNDLDLAESFSQKAAVIFRKINDHNYLSETYLALAGIQEKKGNDSSALRYLKLTLREIDLIGKEYAGPKQATLADALAKLGSFELKNNERKDAFIHLHEALTLAKQNSQLSVMANAASHLSLWWEQGGRADSALYYSKLYNDYYKQQLSDDNIRVLSYQAAKFEFEQQMKTAEVDQLKAESEKRRNYFILAIIIGGLVIATVILFFFLKLGRNRLKQVDLEKKNLKNELEFRNKELTTHVMYQVKNKEFILKISEKLKNAHLIENAEYKKLVKEILSEIDTDSNVDNWKEFEIRFQRVHTDFYKNLSSKFPDLSPNELRMCAFLKLNMATKDIASVTYQTTNSIDVARHRLRQKFGLGKDENLVAFLSHY